jgi:hypothetical protein
MTLLILIISAGTLKHNSISNFFNSILDGTVNLTARDTQVSKDSHKPTLEDQEIERNQVDDLDEEEEDTTEREEGIIHRAIRIQLEKEEREAKDALIDSLHKTDKTNPVVLELRTGGETAHPLNMKASPQAPGSCDSVTVTGSVAPSCASPVSEREPLPNPEDTTSESGRVKDEL